MMFTDRPHAGNLLSIVLKHKLEQILLHPDQILLVPLSSKGQAVASIVAKELGCRLESMCDLEHRHECFLKGKTIILIDDGVVTGKTAMSAVDAARGCGAQKVIVAAAVMSQSGLESLSQYADDAITLGMPAMFEQVEQEYLPFDQTNKQKS